MGGRVGARESAVRGRSVVRTLAVSISLIVVFAMPTGSIAAAESPFRPGLYVGKTSQGYPVKLRLTVGGTPCSGNPCLFAPSDQNEIYIAEPCAQEGETNEYLALFGDEVTRSGVVHADQEGFSKTIATLKVTKHGTLTGKVRATTTLEDGVKCDSGKVTLSARLR
jgi:hypothetical protein